MILRVTNLDNAGAIPDYTQTSQVTLVLNRTEICRFNSQSNVAPCKPSVLQLEAVGFLFFKSFEGLKATY